MRRFLVAIALIFGIVSFGATAAYSLPSGYTELQYIVTNNDAYIVTDLYVNDFDRVTSQLTMYDNSMGLTNGDGAVGAVLFGTTANSTAGAQDGRCFKLYVTSGSGGMTAGYNGTWGGSWSTSLAGKRVPLETPVDIDVKLASGSQWVKIDGTVYGSNSQTAGTLSNTYPVTLFALNYAGTPKGIPHLACESMVFYSGNTVVRNFVPARRNSDNAVGLYDTVTNTFYASSSSSPFVAGPVKIPENSVAITYVMNGGTNYNGAPTSYELGTGATINGVPTKASSVFAGWCTDSNLTSCAMSQTIGTSETTAKTFYAKWTECQACAATNASCSLSIVNNTCTYTTACNSGYTDIQNNGAYNASCVLAGSHTITYVMNGGTNYNSAPETYLEGTGATINGIPTKSGNVFAGWCTDSGLTSCAMSQTIGPSETENKTFYAKWTACPACATTNASCTPNVVNNTCVYATVCNANYGNIQNNGAYNASCSLNSYTISYVMDGGTNYTGAPESYTYGTGATINGTPTKYSNLFAGWCTDSELTNCAMSHTISASDTGNKTFYAKWTVLSSYNINYVLGYGDYVNPRPAYDNAVVPDGYTPTEYIEQTATVKNDTSTIKLDFSGYGTWIIDAQGTGIGATNYNPILVSYEPNTNQTGWFGANPSRYWGAGDNLANFLTRSIINTTFSAGRQDVVINGTITQTYTGSVVTLANWRLFNHSTNPMLVKVFSAKFTQNDELKFNGIPVRRDSDNVCGLYDTVRGIFFTSSAKTNFTCPNAREPDKYTAGTGKEITFVPTRNGIEFLGWCTDSTLTNCSMNPVIPANATGDKTFYAKWQPTYNINYVANGESYTPVEYIESNGNQYILTSYVTNPKTRVYIDYKLNATTGQQYLFGNWGNTGYMCFVAYVNGSAVMGGLTRGGIIRSAGLRSNTTTTDNANAMPSLFGQFTGAAAAHMFENTFRGCAKLSGYVPPKMFEGITGVATDMMTDEFDNSGIATSCPAGYSTATTGFESWWDGRVACEYVGQICVYEEGSANPYKCADGCSWASKLMLYNESWNEFGGFPGYPLMSESVTDHSINISNGTTTCYLPIAENADWGLHVKWNDKVWHAMFAQVDADENGTWGYCTGTYQDNYDGSCTTNSDCDWLYDGNYQPACYQGTCALYNSYGNCYYIMGDTSQCTYDNSDYQA